MISECLNKDLLKDEALQAMLGDGRNGLEIQEAVDMVLHQLAELVMTAKGELEVVEAGVKGLSPLL